jgi:2-oxoisovalerate dehydrogenase E1 component
LVEHNGYGLSTPSKDQFRCENIADKGVGYGIESKIIDGNNVLEVMVEVGKIAQDLRKQPRPFLLECKTFRMRGHEEASGIKYVPEDLLTTWATKDPISNFEKYLVDNKLVEDSELKKIRKKLTTEINAASKILLEEEEFSVSTERELNDVYRQHAQVTIPEAGPKQEKRFIDAIHDGLKLAMRKYDNLVFMGQDIADYGGVFKITDGFVAEFGKERVRNTPISEAAPLGASLGLTIGGKKVMVEMQFADFVSCGFNQIVNNLAKTHYRWGQNTDVVIRMPTGGGAAAGPFHSQSNEAWFFHVPGLKIVYPSTPEDAKGLLLASFEDPNPVLFFEHKNLYRSIKSEVTEAYYTIPLGKARTFVTGNDICFVSYGWGVQWCHEIIDELNLDAHLVDLRSLQPWDKEAVRNAVEATGKVIVVHEDSLTGGIGGEIASWIAEHCFTALDGPVTRVGSLDSPIPFNAKLEENYLGKNRLRAAVERLMQW